MLKIGNTNNLSLVQQGKHTPVLDGIRGFAVSYVLLYHFIPKTLSLSTNNDFLLLWDSFWMMGWSGVDLFFVLSGFLITGILFKSKEKPDYFKNFYIRRVLRIFPLYYLLLLIFLVVFPLFGLSSYDESSKWYWLYLSNFDTELNIPMHQYLVVAWSLAIEEQYYIFYPTLVYFLNYKKWITALCLFICISITLRFFGHFGGFFEPRQFYHFTFAHFDGIALGGLIRLMLFEFDRFKKFFQYYVRFVPVLVALSAILSIYVCNDVLNQYKITHEMGHASFQPAMYLFGYTLNSFTYAGILLWVILRDGKLQKIFNGKLIREIGKYSYAMYLLQYVGKDMYLFIIKFIKSKTEVLNVVLSNPFVATVFTFITCYYLAKLSWYIFEGPMNGLKDKFTKK